MPADPGTGSHMRMTQRPRLAYVLDSLPGIPAEHRDADRRNDPRYAVHLMPPGGREGVFVMQSAEARTACDSLWRWRELVFWRHPGGGSGTPGPRRRRAIQES